MPSAEPVVHRMFFRDTARAALTGLECIAQILRV
jgi:hypothetical protein